jgi:hypothetical protein
MQVKSTPIMEEEAPQWKPYKIPILRLPMQLLKRCTASLTRKESFMLAFDENGREQTVAALTKEHTIW